MRRAASAGALAVLAGFSIAGTAAAADNPGQPQHAPWLVHASQYNACKLNLREGADMTAKAVTTLSCDDYATCVNAAADKPVCGPYVVGGKYSCVGSDNKQVYDNHWVEVIYRGSKTPTYAAAACAAFRQ